MLRCNSLQPRHGRLSQALNQRCLLSKRDARGRAASVENNVSAAPAVEPEVEVKGASRQRLFRTTVSCVCGDSVLVLFAVYAITDDLPASADEEPEFEDSYELDTLTLDQVCFMFLHLSC